MEHLILSFSENVGNFLIIKPFLTPFNPRNNELYGEFDKKIKYLFRPESIKTLLFLINRCQVHSIISSAIPRELHRHNTFNFSDSRLNPRINQGLYL